MLSRSDVLSQAVEQCIRELYSLVLPKVTWEEFKEENKVYNSKYETWKNYRKAFNNKEKDPQLWEQYKKTFKGWKNKSIEECIGPKPFDFYYLPEEIMKDVCDSYIDAYKIDSQKELLDTIEILKNYCKEPIIDKYIEGKGKPGDDDYEPGHKGYEHPNNLEKEIVKILGDVAIDNEYYQHKLLNKFFEFLDMAGEFYNWNRDLNSFNMSVYLGPSPNSNKETVINNWKKYRNIDIVIDEEQIKKEYYGEDD